MTTLFDIAEAYKSVSNMDIDEQAMADTLESLEGEFSDKAKQVAFVLKNFQADIAAIKEQEGIFKSRRERIEKRKESLCAYLQNGMDNLNIDRIAWAELEISKQLNPPSVFVIDEDLVPDKYKTKKEVINIDKMLAKEALQNNEKIEGLTLTQKTRLSVK